MSAFEDAVEAGAKELWRSVWDELAPDGDPTTTWSDVDADSKESWRDGAEEVLMAALPVLLDGLDLAAFFHERNYPCDWHSEGHTPQCQRDADAVIAYLLSLVESGR